jgi:Transposase DDE domain/Transposase
MTMLAEVVDAVIGIDTHRDTHEIEIADPAGKPIMTMRIGNDSAGFRRLLAAIAEAAPGPRVAVCIEGTRSYGIGLARALAVADLLVLECEQPSRKQRRGKGKSDLIDAHLAVLAALRLDTGRLPVPRADDDREGHARDDFRAGYDRREVTCPQGQVSKGWHGPCPTSSPDAAPLIVARFTKGQCRSCPARAACTTSGDGKRTVGFPPRELYELQVRDRAGQQDPAWHKRYAVRSGVEETACDLARGHGMRHCRYRAQPKAHLQHVLTAIAVNIERLSQLPPGQSTSPRPPTAFQDYLDQHDIQRLRSWRAVS